MAGPPPPTRFTTSDGLPPNFGVLSDRLSIQASADCQPGPPEIPPTAQQTILKRHYTSDGKPPNHGLPLNETAHDSPKEQLLSRLLDRLQLRMQAQDDATTKAPEPVAKDLLSFVRDDVVYLFPEKHVNITFLYAGERPCDQKRLWTQNFSYKHVKLPLLMTVGEMVNRLGIPGRCLQEMVELIEPVPQGTIWGPGQVLHRTGPDAEKTLKDIGWEPRNEDEPAWVVHGPYQA